MPLPRPATIDVRADVVVLTQEHAQRTEASLHAQDLRQAITEIVQPVRHALRADVVVSAAHARLFVLPFSHALSSESRWTAYANSRFEETFGEAADAWWLRVVPECPRRPRLVAALPIELMRTLQEMLGQRLRSVRIDTLMRLDEIRLREPGYTGALLDIGPRFALLALMLEGTLCRLRLRRTALSVQDLGAALKVEWAALGRVDELPALAVVQGGTFDASDDAGLSALAPRVLRLH